MAFSRIVYTYSGQTTFAINFTLGYLEQDHVTCRINEEVDGSGDPVYRPLTFVTEGTVSVGGDALVTGDTVTLERTVDKTVVQHDYQNGAVLTESNLDESYKQAIMAVHEVLDGRFSTLTTDLDLGNNKIINLANGVDDTDAANMSQINSVIGDATAQAVISASKALEAYDSSLLASTALSNSLVAQSSTEEARDQVLDLLEVYGNVTGTVGDGITDDLIAINTALANSKLITLEPSTTYFVSELPNFNGHYIVGNGSTILVGDTQQVTSNTIDIDYVSNLTITGNNTYSTVINSVSSVTGTPGDYTVNAVLDDVSNLQIGDALLIRDVKPGMASPSTIQDRPIIGQMDGLNSKLGVVAASGTTVTFAKTGTSNCFNIGDLLITMGQVKLITDIPTSTTITVDSAYLNNFDDQDTHFSMVPSTGTISISGTSMTGVGTSFLTEANVGDIIAVVGGGLCLVGSINSNTSITLEVSQPDITNAVYSINNIGESHEGVWKVSNIVDSTVTWVNTAKTARCKPPVNGIVDGSVTIVKTNINAGSGLNGFKIKSGNLTLNKMVLFGDGGASLEGLEVREQGTSVDLGSSFGIHGFGYNLRVSKSSVVSWSTGYLSAAITRGFSIEDSGHFNARSVISSGNGGQGGYVAFSSFANLNEGRIFNNATDGIRQEGDSNVVAEYLHLIGNGNNGVMSFGVTHNHYVGTRTLKSGADGFQFSNGANGRLSGSLVACNLSEGMNMAHGEMECGKATFMGNKGANIIMNRSKGSLILASSTFSASYGLRVIGNTSVIVDEYQSGYNAVGVRAEDHSNVSGDDVVVLNNTGTDLQCAGNQFPTVHLANLVGAPVCSPSINTFNSNGSGHITDGTSSSNFSTGDLTCEAAVVDGITINGTSTLKGVRAYSQAINLGIIPANSKVTSTVSVTAAIQDGLTFSFNGGVPLGLEITAQLTSTNTITVTGQNHTSSDVTTGNKTMSFVVFDIT